MASVMPMNWPAGISQALITTAAGLTVAIPSYFFYRYFKGRVDEYVISMEEEAINLIEAIERGTRPSWVRDARGLILEPAPPCHRKIPRLT